MAKLNAKPKHEKFQHVNPRQEGTHIQYGAVETKETRNAAHVNARAQ